MASLRRTRRLETEPFYTTPPYQRPMAETPKEVALREQIADLSQRADQDRRHFDPPADPPDEELAMTYLREGFGQAVWCYVDARTDGFDHIDPETFEALEDAMNGWLELYARCYGYDITAEFTVRKAAELLLETHNVRDTAVMLTHVPERDAVE